MTARRFRSNRTLARQLWGKLPTTALHNLKELTTRFSLSVASGDLMFLNNRWYVTHSGLLRLAARKRCSGVRTSPEGQFCDPASQRWAFKAVVYKSPSCRGFVGYGDADPSNVSPLVHGAEMRVAETRAVNRALRKAYGIGICLVEEIGSFPVSTESASQAKKFPLQPANGGSANSRPKVRDRLCQLIRQHQLDPILVKAYAADFCGVKSVREATRAQVENFVQHVADKADKDRTALICQLNSYLYPKEAGTQETKERRGEERSQEEPESEKEAGAA